MSYAYHDDVLLDFAEQIFAAVLGLYMENGTQSLPNSDEVLICTSETTAEEVTIFTFAQVQLYRVGVGAIDPSRLC